MTAGRTNSRDKILDAAEEIVRERGATALTMDALAHMTGVGKGGVLYHFKLKVDLHKAMLERHCQRWETQLKEDAVQRGDDDFAWLESFVDFGFHKQEIGEKSATSIIAAAAEKPALLEPLRRTYARRLKRALAHTDDPYLVAIILLAIDGLTFFSGISAPQVDEAMRERIFQRVQLLIEEMKKRQTNEKRQ